MSAPDEPVDAPLSGRRSSGWWGAALGAVGAGTVLLFLLYAYFYLWVSADEGWPPRGVARPPLLAPAAVAALLLVSLAPARWVGRAASAADALALRRAALTLAALGAATAVGVVLVLLAQGLDPGARAYDAIVVTLHAYHGAATVAGLGVAAGAAWHATALTAPSWVWTAGEVARVWWLYVVGGWLAIGLAAYAWPQGTS